MGSSPTDAERYWEKDLLATDFLKKQVGASHYFCPLDKVVKALSFLLDIGWMILDFRGKQLVRATSTEVAAEESGAHFILRGKINYADHKVDLKDVVGAFNRREKFLDLSATTVGLVELGKELEDLEFVFDEAAIKRSRFTQIQERVRLPTQYQSGTWKERETGPSFQGKLYPYQQQGLNWLSFLYECGFAGLLADEMGLGKTVQILAFFSTLKTEKPILIVCPSSLVFNWKKEIEKFLQNLPLQIQIISYARLRLDLDVLFSQEYECVVLDEAQAIKNSQTATAQAACKLQARFRVAVTGTPVENRSEDLLSLFHFLMPDLLGENQNARNIRPFLLRRRKEEVLLDLPEKINQTVWIEMGEEQRSFYDNFLTQSRRSVVEKVSEKGVSKSRFEILEVILRLRQICCHPHLVSGTAPAESSKLEQLLSDLEEVASSGKKALIYSQFTSMLRLIEKKVQERGWRSVYLDGETRNRGQVVEQFQSDAAISFFLISLKAGGVGLNLTAADFVFLYDPWWNDAVENQAIDRAHRLGRKERVVAKRYLAAETIEEKIFRLKKHKQKLADDLLDFEGSVGDLSAEDLLALLE